MDKGGKKEENCNIRTHRGIRRIWVSDFFFVWSGLVWFGNVACLYWVSLMSLGCGLVVDWGFWGCGLIKGKKFLYGMYKQDRVPVIP